jgi:hypothetical protein
MQKSALPLILALFLLTGCLPLDPNDQYIQGAWQAAGDLGEGHSWYLKWTFKNGTFSVDGYPPLTQTGNYRVKSSIGSALTLELTNQKGDWPTDDRTITVLIDKGSNTMTIDNQGPFSRTDP